MMSPEKCISSVLSTIFLLGCSGSGDAPNSSNAGGNGAVGGSISSGGRSSTAGSSSIAAGGLTSSTGGRTVTGTVPPANGGSLAVGGSSKGGTGNAATTGGNASGGTTARGGSTASTVQAAGGSTTAGSTAKGGTTSVGGQATGGSTTTGSTAKGGSTGTGGGSAICTDTCPAPSGGVTVGCKKRFMYGVNYAWANFGNDFGGLATWNQPGVAGAKAARTTDMTDMANNGVDVIRWWMFPQLGSDAIKLDGSKTPTGLGTTVVSDINAALSIAAQLNVHIKLTLFSFDSFWADYTVNGVPFPSLQPMVTDATKRAALIANVIVPIAKAVAASPDKDRMIAWDVINEPEWSITGTDPYGDPAFEPTTTGSDGKVMAPVSYTQMETFVKEVVTALHANSTAPVTVGGAAVKWAKAWSQVGLDFYDFHWYGWVDQYYSHKNTPAYYKVSDKPVVVGEFPLIPSGDKTGLSFGGISYGTFINDLVTAGYAGAQGWSFSDAAFGWSTAKADVKAWQSAHTCYTHY